MANEAVLPTPDAWRRVGDAVRIVEGGRNSKPAAGSLPYVFPAVIYKVTGAAVDGFYPGKLLAWDMSTEAYVETEDCEIVSG